MKMTKLSEKLLKYMVVEYKNHGTDMFSFETFKDLHPNETDDFISKALYRLRDEDLVSVYAADNVAYNTVLLPQGIAYCEENNFLKNGYKIVKEARSWLP
ncbi:lactate permease [Bacillus wiedmannii]|uniref:Lactate permease n=1 Tax=Bacillus wiedmannii TaxID=1890302 RepID=A0A4U3B1E2_9BACI|nr:lactate permease [Bacillus wiedmannii]